MSYSIKKVFPAEAWVNKWKVPKPLLKLSRSRSSGGLQAVGVNERRVGFCLFLFLGSWLEFLNHIGKARLGNNKGWGKWGVVSKGWLARLCRWNFHSSSRLQLIKVIWMFKVFTQVSKPLRLLFQYMLAVVHQLKQFPRLNDPTLTVLVAVQKNSYIGWLIRVISMV